MNKHDRQAAIREIISMGSGSTQEEIRATLLDRGIDISQSTLSRDLRELGAVKMPLAVGGFAYRLDLPDESGVGGGEITRAMHEYATGQEQIANFLIINTTAGNARDLCLVIDRQRWSEIAGTIAGDDTILVVGRNSRDIAAILQKLNWIEGKDYP